MIRDEQFWHQMFMRLNDKWTVLKYQSMTMRDWAQAKLDRQRLASFQGSNDEGAAKAEYEAYDAIVQLIEHIENAD